ncbi:MAG: single-stranded-DNA-specific exonuclease RecJ [Planctomycetes bacterium]|nr:single-stranded-DNA-specific exonuclease RecJ [Planctomycetota bacterium]
MPKQWTIKPPFPDAEKLAQAIGIPAIIARILGQRGLETPEQARAFLKPDLSQLHDPAAMPGLIQAADRLVAAARAAEPIVIYGDYDVDGITGSAILWQALRLADANVRVYVPHRLEEGYGLNLEAVEKLAAEGARVLVTVDCGISGAAEAARARELGLDVIITDHHEPNPDRLPPAFALVNPKMPGSPYPFRDLSGAGIALKLAWAIGQKLSERQRVSDPFREFLIAATGLAALGTIADVVPLVGENHVLASFGLRALAGTKHPGILALVQVAGLAERALDADHIGFMLGPRLNAAGRMGHAREAVELLTTAGPEAALAIAKDLDRRNRERQDLEKHILQEAEAQVAQVFRPERDAAIVLAAPGWHAGVIGIVASRIVERYWRPTLLIGTAEGRAQGSGRSIAGFHMYQALATCEKHLTNYGGHAMAAGIRLSEEAVPAFREAFLAHAAKTLGPEQLTARLIVDAEATLADIDLGTARLLDRMGPFGAGNPRAVFALRQVKLAAPPRRIGRQGDHLEMQLTEGGRARRALGWNLGPACDALARAGSCGVAFTCRISTYSGRPEVELHLKDLWVGRYGDASAAKEFA